MSFQQARERAQELDASDLLAHLRQFFDIPERTLYFDGNSLGPLTFASRDVLHRTIEFEWRERWSPAAAPAR